MFDNWREAFAALKKRIEEVFSSVEGIKDELVKQRRAHEDEINNITFDNMPSIKKVLLQSDNSVAGLTVKVDKNAADIKAVAETVNSLDNIYASASYEQKVDAQEAQITSLVQFQDNTTKNISLIKAVSDKNKSDIALLAKTDTELSQSIAKVNVKTSENQSQIENVAKVVAQNVSSIATTKETADANSASIKDITEWQGETSESIATIEQTVKENSSKIGLVVETKEGEDVVKSASIVMEATEDESVIEAIADKLNIDGYVTFTNLKESGGSTVINGSNITTGTIDASSVKVTNLNANNIIVGEIKSSDGESYWNLESGEMKLGNYIVGSDVGGIVIANKDSIGYQDASDVTTITENTIKTTNVEAENLKVKAANISGKLTASQINADGISAKEANISGTINSNSGNIGGWQISETVLTYNDGVQSAMDIGAGQVQINQGNSVAYLGKDGNYYTRLAVANLGKNSFIANKDGLFVNGYQGITGTFALSNGSITVENGLIISVDIEDVPSDPTEYVATPAFRPSSGTIYGSAYITLYCATDDATIYYNKINARGEEDSGSGTRIWVSYENDGGSVEISAYAIKDGMLDSDSAYASYTILPSSDEEGGV